MNKRVLMAMSGGIDSTVAAILLKEQGFDLVGVTYRTYDSMKESCIEKEKGCCTIDSIMEAKHMAETLGFEHHILDLRNDFSKHVINNFCDEYMKGRTPNPCVICNATIKWGKLWEMAERLGCEYIATGHYARVEEFEGHHYLLHAHDTHKDQTYFLWLLDEEHLSRTLFPLGGFTKPQVREIALNHGFEKLSKKTESQEICFIPNDDYRSFLASHVEDYSKRCVPGDFVDVKGNKLGMHQGFPNYTIGQRKGLRIALGEPMFVADIDAERNRVVLAKRDELSTNSLRASRCRFTDIDYLKQHRRVMAQIRYRSAPTVAEVEFVDNEHVVVHFDDTVWGVTPGQSLVLYQDNRLVGGGFID